MKKTILISTILLPVLASAHEGHGPVDNGLAHYLLSPIHLIGVLAAIVAAVGLYKYYRTRKQKDA